MNIRLSFSLKRLKALLKTETYEYGFKERIGCKMSLVQTYLK